jgi:peptide chain release factor subunit 1
VRDVFAALAQGAIETLIVWDDLDIIRVSVKNSETGETEYRHMTPEQRKANEQVFRERERKKKKNWF